MRKLILALAFMAGCVAYADPVEADYEYCMTVNSWTSFCDSDYIWVGDSYSWAGYYHRGHYVRRWPAAHYPHYYRPYPRYQYRPHHRW